MCDFCNDMKYPIKETYGIKKVKYINEEYVTKCVCCGRTLEIGVVPKR